MRDPRIGGRRRDPAHARREVADQVVVDRAGRPQPGRRPSLVDGDLRRVVRPVAGLHGRRQDPATLRVLLGGVREAIPAPAPEVKTEVPGASAPGPRLERPSKAVESALQRVPEPRGQEALRPPTRSTFRPIHPGRAPKSDGSSWFVGHFKNRRHAPTSSTCVVNQRIGA